MERYRRSLEWLARAEKVIPLGSQTFSKSPATLPRGASPCFLERGLGSRVWDVDGNEYIDFINGLLAVSLGYRDPDIDAAVRHQLDLGVTFSLPHPLESEVAESIVELVPCAEMVRFAKNGSDATAGAVRLARACTGRDRVAACGYHGWQDWYIGATARNLGVPQSTRALTHVFGYNDAASLERLLADHPGEFAAVIMEPMNTEWPRAGFLEAVAELTRRHGALLVFDEIITGFRFASGGAQQLFGVTPDLATFGKGLGNGYPISVVTGRHDLMRRMEEIFFSFTFGGETLALAAAKAFLAKLRSAPVLESIHARGEQLLEGLRALVERHGAARFAAVSGHPAWPFFVLKDAGPYTAMELRTLYLQEMFARGFLVNGGHGISYAHDEADIQSLLSAYDEVLPLIGSALDARDLPARLHCEPLVPLFRVR